MVLLLRLVINRPNAIEVVGEVCSMAGIELRRRKLPPVLSQLVGGGKGSLRVRQREL